MTKMVNLQHYKIKWCIPRYAFSHCFSQIYHYSGLLYR